MIKTLCLFSLLTINLNKSYSVESRVKPLVVLVTDFIVRKWPQFKEKLHQKLLKGELAPEALKMAGRTFYNRDFSGVYWKGASFRNCEFIGVNFKGADLREVDFEGAKFEKCVFGLFEINLRYLDKAILYCPLDDKSEPILEDAFRFNSSLSDLGQVCLYARLIRMSRRAEKNAFVYKERRNEFIKKSRKYYEEAQSLNRVLGLFRLCLKSNNLKHIKLDGICLRGANLEAVNLNGSKIKNADFREANLENAKFNKSKIKNVDFHKANLNHIKLNQSKIKNVNFQEVNLQYGYFQRSILKNINFKDAKLKKGWFYNASLDRVDFQGTDISDTSFKKAYLKKIDFKNMQTYGDFNESILEDVDFDKAKGDGLFRGVILSDSLILPDPCLDAKLIELYHFCDDCTDKRILKSILKKRNLFVHVKEISPKQWPDQSHDHSISNLVSEFEDIFLEEPGDERRIEEEDEYGFVLLDQPNKIDFLELLGKYRR